jgi:hypothetical protein
LPDQDKTVSFPLPKGESLDVYLVKLPNGRVVARTADELAALPENLRGEIQPPAR